MEQKRAAGRQASRQKPENGLEHSQGKRGRARWMTGFKDKGCSSGEMPIAMDLRLQKCPLTPLLCST